MLKHIKDYSSFQITESVKFDHRDTDIQTDFDILNKKMFNGEIERVPLKWIKTKYKLGVVTHTKDGGIDYLGISTFYDITRQQYLNVLAHEMIHVYMIQKGIMEKDHHGPKFMEFLNRINAEHPEFNLSKSNNALDFKVAPKEKTSPDAGTYGVVLFDLGNNDLSVVVVNQKAIQDESQMNTFMDYIIKHGRILFPRTKNGTVEVYLSDHPDLSKFKVKRSLSLRSMELFVISEKMVEEIREDGELVIKETLN